MIYLELIFNLSLLIALSIVSGFIGRRRIRHSIPGKLLQGVVFGGAAMLGMLHPMNLGPGLIFDGRSIMISLCAMFFGPWAAGTASVMTICLRLFLGGTGMITGSLVILSSAGIGLFAYYWFKPSIRAPSFGNLLFLGIIVHIAMLVMMFTLPGGAGFDVVKRIGLPVILLYPLATILAGKILSDHIKSEQILAALERRNHEMQAIGNCNRILLQADNEQELLDEICRIICDEAGYRMAWVGKPENNAAKSVRPIAWAGIENNYLSTVNITWADTEYGQGPTGTAVRTGKTSYIQDFMKDTKASPWRENALKRGYRSSIALPLKDETSKIIGVLNIYSTVPDAFIPSEIQLLEGLAENLAFGIVTLRTRAERDIAEQALNRSEEKYRNFFMTSRDCVFITSFEGKWIDFNDSAIEMFGYENREELMKVPIRELYSNPNERSGFLKEIIEKGYVEERPFIMKKGDGTVFNALITATVVKKKNGSAEMFVGTIRDITRRKQEEEARRLSELNLKTFLNTTSDMAFLKDEYYRHIFANLALQNFFKKELSEIIGRTDFDLMPAAAAETCRESDQKALEENKAVTTEEVIGEHYYETVKFPVKLGEGQVGIGGFIREITERKSFEKKILQSEQRKTIINRIAGIFLSSPDEEIYGEILAVILSALKSKSGFFGYIEENGDLVITAQADSKCEEFAETEKSLVYPPDTWKENLWGKTLTEKISFLSNSPFPVHEGYKKIFNYITVPLTFGSSAIGMISVANSEKGYTYDDQVFLEEIAGFVSPIINARLQRDRQERIRRNAEAERESYHSQLLQAQKMESVGRLAGGVAHDFNNMLGVIIGHTEILLEQVDPALPIFANLQEIRKAAGRSVDLTRQLLAFARKQSIAPRSLDINTTVEGILKMLRRMIGEDINLVWLPGKNVWPVKIDPSQIDQILANLCVNARDAITGVGKITIETQSVTFDESYCTNHPEYTAGDYVMLAVTDDGCGMSEETLEKVFEPYFTTKDIGKGTGLGLATVYGIVKQNEGYINVFSIPGQGTSFRIYLPRYKAITEQHTKEDHTAPNMHGHETLLVVEDEPSILDMVRIILEGLGYQVLTASSPSEAISVAKEHFGKIHLLVTDVVMPEMNGRDLAKELVSHYPEMKLLYMSGYAGDIVSLHGVLVERVNFIQKPFSRQTLAAKVREALDNKQ
jgi:PAS domain S-box-containing protein